MQNAAIEDVQLSSRLKNSMGTYGIYVNFHRAIPSVLDGLKPVHRRVIHSMSEEKMRHSDGYSKAAKAVGSIMGNYHPHGDSAIYTTMVGMQNPWLINVPLVDGQGNWGSKTDGEAAPRYTECRLTKSASMLMGWHPGQTGVRGEIFEDAVNWVSNYDGKLHEPDVLPALYPNYVINGTVGIGFGTASSSPSHNVREVMALASYMVDTPNPSIEKVRKFVLGPEVPDNCEIYDSSDPNRNISSYMLNGEGAFFLRARMDVEEYEMGTARKPKTGYIIRISGLPPETNAEQVVDEINSMIEWQGLPLGVEVSNDSHGEVIDIVVDISNNNPDDIKARLLTNNDTGLQTSRAVFSKAFDPYLGEIRQIGTIEAVRLWLEHRRTCITRRSSFRRKRAKERSHIVEGFILAVPIAEEIVVLVKASESKTEANEEMQTRWGFSKTQATAVLEMNIGQITKLGVDKYMTELHDLNAEIAENTKIIDEPSYLNTILKGEIKAVGKEIGRDRISHVMEGSAWVERPSTPAVEEPTINGYLVKTGRDYLRWIQSSRFGRQLSDDHVVEVLPVTNKNMVEMVSSWGYHSRMDMDEIPKNVTSGKMIFSGYLDAGENVTCITSAAPFGGLECDLYGITSDGMGKRVGWEVWAHPGKKALRFIAPSEGETVSSSFFAPADKDIMVISKYGKAIKIDPENITQKGRGAQPNEFMSLTRDGEGNLQKGEGVAMFNAVSNTDRIVYWTNEGKLGSFIVGDIRRQARGGRGSWIIHKDASFYVVDARVVSGEEESIKWFHGTFNEPRVVSLEDIPVGTSLDANLLEAPGINDAAAIWIE